MGLLNKTKYYTIGHMQYANGESWREKITKELEPLGISCYNPYRKPFLNDVAEGDDVRLRLAEQMKTGEYDAVHDHMKKVRQYDLNLVDRSDFLVAHLIPEVASWGSGEEIVTAVRCKRPVFLSIEGSKHKTPLWIMGMIPHKYIYNNIDEIIAMIKKIDAGEVIIDSDRWRLLDYQYR